MPTFDLLTIGHSNIPAERAERGVSIGHILHDGTTTPHGVIERLLLAEYDGHADLFSAGHGDRLAAAYRRHARAVAYRAKSAASGTSAASGASAAAETR